MSGSLTPAPPSRAVRPVEPDEQDAFYAMLARAFEDDPVSEYLFPDPGSRLRRLRSFYRSMMGSMAVHGRLDTTDGIAGGAIWMAPNPPKPRGAALASMLLRSAWQLRGRVLAGLSLGRTLEEVHEPRPHWYLAMLGTDPVHQRSGVGSALLAPVLERCDRDGTLAYLESSKEQNLPFYRRHGFEVQREVQIEGGPKLWPMLREPRPPGSPAGLR